jgi:hypothetical protein
MARARVVHAHAASMSSYARQQHAQHIRAVFPARVCVVAVHDVLDAQEQPRLFQMLTDNVHDMHNQRDLA